MAADHVGIRESTLRFRKVEPRNFRRVSLLRRTRNGQRCVSEAPSWNWNRSKQGGSLGPIGAVPRELWPADVSQGLFLPSGLFPIGGVVPPVGAVHPCRQDVSNGLSRKTEIIVPSIISVPLCAHAWPRLASSCAYVPRPRPAILPLFYMPPSLHRSLQSMFGVTAVIIRFSRE